ncbi:MAG: flagellar biosynthetic protein FliR [Chloroflexi bacterium]|nr:flagellar biosynthetic protein FliR [Chloroflexota bacterium]
MLVSIAQAQLFFLALTRTLAILIQVPVLGGRLVPNIVKVGLGISLAAIMLTWQPLPPGVEGMPFMAFTWAIGRELLIGTLAGFAAVLTFGAISVAGHVMELGSGFSAGQILNPASGESGSALSNFVVITATLLFLAINGHHLFLFGLQRTFTILPLNQPLPELSLETLLNMTAHLITAGVQIALPVAGAVLLTDLTLGLIAKAAPRVQIFFLGFPLKVGIGLLVLSLALVIIFPQFTVIFEKLGERTLALIGG